MFKTLMESLSSAQQTELISQSLERGGKGLQCSQEFLTLPLEDILYSLAKKVNEYKKSYSRERLSRVGVETDSNIEVDKIAETLLFCRRFLSEGDKSNRRKLNICFENFDKKILQLYPLISLDQLQLQLGGVNYGYWLLAKKLREDEVSLEIILEKIRPYLIGNETILDESEPLDFEEELKAYSLAKIKNKYPPCSYSGEIAEAITSVATPYKSNVYSHRNRLTGRTVTQSASRSIQKELTLRKICFGKDLEQERVWIYSDIPFESSLLIESSSQKNLRMLYRGLKMVVEKNAHILISTSLIPYEIEENYLIENFPSYLFSWGCQDRGTIKDAQHILDVLDAFYLVFKKSPRRKGMIDHLINSNGDILYVLHQLKYVDAREVGSLALVQEEYQQ